MADTTTDNMLGRAAKEGKKVKFRQVLLENRRQNWDTIYKKVGKHINPLRTDIDQDDEPGTEYGNESFDGTGMNALNIATNGIYGNMLSPAIRWFMNSLRDPDMLQIREVKLWLQNVDEHLYSQFNGSNWYDESFTWIKDTWAGGTGYMYPHEDIEEGGFNFLTLHPGQCYIIRNAMGRVVGLHRKFKMQLQQMVDMFGKDKLPASVKTSFDTNPFNELEMIHAVYPNDLFDSSSVLAINKRFTSIWVLNQGANDDEAVLRFSGMDRFPFIVNHYERGNDEDYGRSPGMYALFDIMGQSLMSKHMLAAAERSVDPPFAVPDDVDEAFNLLSRGITYYEDPNRIPFPIETSLNFDFAIERERDKREAIRQHFHVDFFLLLASTERGRTATEVLELQGEKASILGSSIGRLYRGLDQVIDFAFWNELDAGRLPQPPEILLEAGSSIDTIYLGPLAQIQKRLFQNTGIRRGLEEVLPLADVFPEILDNFDGDEIARELATGAGMPEKVLIERTTVEKGRAIRNAKREQEEALAQLAVTGEIAKDSAKAQKDSADAGAQVAEVGEELVGEE